MNEVKLYPIPHSLLEELYPHVFNNEFEQRKIISVIDLPFFATSHDFLVGVKITAGEITCAEVTNSKGEVEIIHFWKMTGNRWTNYQPRTCYSFIKKANN